MCFNTNFSFRNKFHELLLPSFVIAIFFEDAIPYMQVIPAQGKLR